ncbi:MAG: HTTM domain-containing protein [Bacteroidota bacterium]
MSKKLWQPVSIAGLVFFRIAFGLLGFADLLGSWGYHHLYQGTYNPDNYQFKYIGWEWAVSLAEPWMSLFFLTGMALAIMVILGYRYRWSAPLFATFYTYYFLLEKAHYLNHGYFFCWVAWVMACLPAWRAASLDVWRKPTQYRAQIPLWCHAIVPFLMGMVYFFGGIAKLNADWLLRAMPLKLWLAGKADKWLIGPWLELPSTAWVMSIGGAAFDLSITFLLLFRRTRPFAFAWAVAFHLTNHLVFNIGIFPYLSVAATALFFRPDWPLRFWRWLTQRWRKASTWHERWKQRLSELTLDHSPIWQARPRNQNYLLLGFVSLLLVHSFLPLRHHLYPGDVAWTEDGHRYAWRMMLRSKKGHGHYKILDIETQERSHVDPRDSLTPRQYRKLWTHPDMILQYAHHLRDQAAERGQKIAIYAHVRTRLNDGKYQVYIDDKVDLAQVEWQWWKPASWILLPISEE